MIWHVLSCNNTGLWLHTENKPQIKEISTQGYFKISLKKTQTHLRTQVTTHLCIRFNGSSHKRAHFFKKTFLFVCLVQRIPGGETTTYSNTSHKCSQLPRSSLQPRRTTNKNFICQNQPKSFLLLISFEVDDTAA